MISFSIQYFIQKQVYQIIDLFSQTFILPHAIQIGIRFQNMQMRIHGFLLVFIFITQTHIFYRTPVAGKSFQITILFCIKAILLDNFKQTFGIIQSLSIPCSTRIFTQAVNSKAYGINLFFCINRISFIIKFPINTSKITVIEEINQITLCTCSSFKIFFFSQQAISSRESPQNTCIENCSFRS